MKIAICDDEEYFRNKISSLVEKYATENKQREITIFTFSHAEDMLDASYKKDGFDIYLLDIVMPDMNGIDAGHQLRKDGYDGKIIYLTTSEEFAIDAYKVDADNYILKPIDENHFYNVLDKAVLSLSNIKEKHIMVKTKSSNIKLNFNNILYAELVNRSVRYHLKDGQKIESVSIRTNFSDTLKELIADKRFTPCGASMLINMHHIQELQADTIIFAGGDSVSVGKKICRDVRNSWLDFCFNSED